MKICFCISLVIVAPLLLVHFQVHYHDLHVSEIQGLDIFDNAI